MLRRKMKEWYSMECNKCKNTIAEGNTLGEVLSDLKRNDILCIPSKGFLCLCTKCVDDIYVKWLNK